MSTKPYTTRVRNVISPAARVTIAPAGNGDFHICCEGRVMATAGSRRDADQIARSLRALDSLQAMATRIALLEDTLAIASRHNETVKLRRAFGHFGDC